jgi:hypothetical protein
MEGWTFPQEKISLKEKAVLEKRGEPNFENQAERGGGDDEASAVKGVP